ncbi:hypothetical protein CFE70_002003 [Pyrenophora teres f. teres 0-1]
MGVVISGYKSELSDCSAGLFQGSPLSMILLSFLVIIMLDISFKEVDEVRVFKMAFCDDFHLIAVLKEKFKVVHFCSLKDCQNSTRMSHYIPAFKNPEKSLDAMRVLCLFFHVDRRDNPKWKRHNEHVRSKVIILAAVFARLV